MTWKRNGSMRHAISTDYPGNAVWTVMVNYAPQPSIYNRTYISILNRLLKLVMSNSRLKPLMQSFCLCDDCTRESKSSLAM